MMDRRDFLRKTGLGALALTMVGARPDSIFSPEPEPDMSDLTCEVIEWGDPRVRPQFWAQLQNEPKVYPTPRTTVSEVQAIQGIAEERLTDQMEALGRLYRDRMETATVQHFWSVS